MYSVFRLRYDRYSMPRTVLVAILCALAACAPHPDPLPGIPRLVLWAWERPERLDFIDPHAAGVAYLAQAGRLRQAAANAVDYLCSASIAWARSHPRDLRVPEALHLAVRATHYGRTDKASGGYSQEAFKLLHSRYPDSTWAQKTTYWY
jgi:hypothetical protein